MLFSRVNAVIVAAGNSSRMNSDIPKVYMSLRGKPVLLRTAEAFEKSECISSITVVVREEDIDFAKEMLSSVTKLNAVVAGGKDRRHSVLNGVRACGDCDFIAIHDGARPLISQDDIESVVKDGMRYGAAALAAPVKDTIKSVSEDSFVEATPDRSRLRSIFTPQVFGRDEYLSVAESVSDSVEFTDDCQLFEINNKSVFLTMGSYKNIKITTPEDMLTAEAFLKDSSEEREKMFRVGHGYDVHKLVEGRKLIIGGVEIPHKLGLLGHSDADVLLHAISDALLGAAALGDIGHLFPDNDPQYEGISSMLLLKRVANHLRENGFSIGNIDATVIAQKPKLMPYIISMRENIAACCGIEVSSVSVKATTEEGLGFSGTEQGIAAHCVCIIF